MTRAWLAALALVTAVSSASAQTDDDLRALYSKRDIEQMAAIAATGDHRAQAWMGLIMRQSRRRSEAMDWFWRSAEQGNAMAITNLASMHLQDNEDDHAAMWSRRGAELGIATAQDTYARLLRQGRGVPKDEREAVKWFTEAARQGFAYAYEALADMKSKGEGTSRDLVEAYALAHVADYYLASEGGRIEKFKNGLARELSPQQIERASRRAREIRAGRSKL
jgi:TPR repeat protein